MQYIKNKANYIKNIAIDLESYKSIAKKSQ